MLSKRLIYYIISGVVLLAVLIIPSFFRLLTDWYWFQEIGFSNIFTTILRAKIFLGLAVGILSFIIIYGNLWLARKLVASKPLIIPMQGVVGLGTDRAKELDLEKYIHIFALPVSLILGFFTGLVGAGSWETALKYFNAVSFGVEDPIFGRDIAFYLFNLPFVQFLIGLGFWLIIASLLGAAASYILRGAIYFPKSLPRTRTSYMRDLFIEKPAKLHLSILIALFFVLTGLKIYMVRIPSLLYGSTGPFTGASFTDIHAMLPFLKILIFVAAVVAIVVIVSAFGGKSSNRLLVSALGF
ncbi:UPF0182 family protein, partial [Patescibacteria group bacterium]|nr:UPF0182 family protein [Patescibacteria group bacterium]